MHRNVSSESFFGGLLVRFPCKIPELSDHTFVFMPLRGEKLRNCVCAVLHLSDVKHLFRSLLSSKVAMHGCVVLQNSIPNAVHSHSSFFRGRVLKLALSFSLTQCQARPRSNESMEILAFFLPNLHCHHTRYISQGTPLSSEHKGRQK